MSKETCLTETDDANAPDSQELEPLVRIATAMESVARRLEVLESIQKDLNNLVYIVEGRL